MRMETGSGWHASCPCGRSLFQAADLMTKEKGDVWVTMEIRTIKNALAWHTHMSEGEIESPSDTSLQTVDDQRITPKEAFLSPFYDPDLECSLSYIPTYRQREMRP